MLAGVLLFLLPILSGSPPGWQRNAPIDAIRAATVLVEVLGPRGRSTGTGFVVADDATVVTAAHVLQGAWLARVRLPSGESVPVLGVRDLDRGLDVTMSLHHLTQQLRSSPIQGTRVGRRIDRLLKIVRLG